MAASSCEIFFYVIFFHNFATFMNSKWFTNYFYSNLLSSISWVFLEHWLVEFRKSVWRCLCSGQWKFFQVPLSVAILSFSVNIIAAFSRNPTVVRNVLINIQKPLLVWTAVFLALLKYAIMTFRRRDTPLYLFFI